MIEDSEEVKKKFLITLKKTKKTDFQIVVNAQKSEKPIDFSDFMKRVGVIHKKIAEIEKEAKKAAERGEEEEKEELS